MEDKILEIEELSIIRSDKEISSIDLIIKRKETVIISSVNNSGSLILDSILLKDKADKGDIRYFGDSIFNYSSYDIDDYRSKDVSFIDDYNSFFDEFDVYNNIYLTANLNRIDIDSNYVNEIIDVFKIRDILYSSVSKLSYFDFIKAKTVRSLLSSPFILLVYDSLSKMSNKEKNEYMMMLNRINSLYGITIIIETRDMHLNKYASSSYIIDEGTIINAND